MKVIGEVAAKLNEEGEAENKDYLGGSIVMLSQREMVILRQLQDAANGHKWHFVGIPASHITDDVEMDNLFWLVRQFIEAKFAINEFKGAIERLDGIMMKAEASE